MTTQHKPIARHESVRRGTVLLMVVGALALAAVITIAYVTVGKQDRRTSSAIKRANTFNDVPEIFSEYVAGVLADDVLQTYQIGDFPPSLIDPSEIRREGVDYPFTPWLNANGTIHDFFGFAPAGDRSDPWLASTVPTWNGVSTTTSTGPADAFMDVHDWDHISNISPSGLFVNLSNLRGNFDVRSGTLPGRLSSNLTLFTNTGTATTSTMDFGTGTSPVDITVPAYMDSHQTYLFRPAQDTTRSPNLPDYLPNQYADADGDGMFDSRWFELVDFDVQPSPARPSTRLMPNIAGLRFFFATRIIDLSSLVNVNTATDFFNPPSRSTPAGFTPADVDLRRLLGMTDEYDVNAGAYDLLFQPGGAGAADDYGLMDVAAARTAGLEGYKAFRQTIFSGLVPIPGSAVGLPTSSGFDNFDFAFMQSDDRANYYIEFGSQPFGTLYSGTNYTIGSVFGIDSFTELFRYRTMNDPKSVTRLEQALGGRIPAPAALRNLSPLRDNRDFTLELDRIGDNTDEQPPLQIQRLFAVDIRQMLTTISGARPLLAGAVVDPVISPIDYTTQLDPSRDVRLDTVTLMKGAAGTGSSSTGRNNLFKLYADALIPYSDVFGIWDPSYTDLLRVSTLNYGYSSPEIGIRLAAHMTANMIDLYDENTTGAEEPSVLTVIIDEDYRDELDAGAGIDDPNGDGVSDFPYWRQSKKLDLGAQRIANTATSDQVFARAINVFGIEAEPFLTEVASFAMYTDAPSNAGGDSDWGAGGGLPGEPTIIVPITINGNRLVTNSDYLFQIIAFQITNPYDQTIQLGGFTTSAVTNFGDITGAQDADFYYTEFGGHFFMLANMQEQVGGTADISPVTLQPNETVVFYATNTTKNDILNRIDTVDVDGVTLAPDASVLNRWVSKQLEGIVTNFDRSFHMPRIDFTASGGSSGQVQLNNDFQDLISLDTTKNQVVNLWRTVRVDTEAPTETNGNHAQENDRLVDRLRDPGTQTLDHFLPQIKQDISDTSGKPDSGVPATRGDNTGYTITTWATIRRPDSAQLASGALPAYCVEIKSGTSKNDGRNDGFSLSSLSKSDFSGSDEAARSLASTLSGQYTADLINSLVTHPDNKINNPIGTTIDGRSYTAVMAEMPRNDNRFLRNTNSTIRPADLLLPTAFGPFQNPFAANINDQWTTLSEAMALAYNYDSIGGFMSLPPDPMTGLGDPNRALGPLLSNGHLVLDDYVPYLNINPDGPIPVFDETAPGDIRMGRGIPLALNLLDATFSLDSAVGSISRPVRGAININTAPLAVLRTLPMLSPSTGLASGSMTRDDWWGIGGPLDGDSDIAATLLAYRDKALVDHRPNLSSTVLTTDFTEASSASTYMTPLDALANPPQARQDKTLVDALREQPGFGSIAEVMMAFDQSTRPQGDPNNINFLAFDSASLDAPRSDGQNFGLGIDSVRYGTAGTGQDDGIDDDYDEQFAIAGSLLNTISVSSDIYACWFIVNGYAREDVENLSPDEPMIPTYAKRFLMVIDRSNVQKIGDRPRILFMRELPM